MHAVTSQDKAQTVSPSPTPDATALDAASQNAPIGAGGPALNEPDEPTSPGETQTPHSDSGPPDED